MRSTEQTRAQKTAEFAFYILLMIPFVILALSSTYTLERSLCPNDAFLCGTLHPSIQKYSLVGAGAMLAMVIEYWLAYFIRPLDRLFGTHVDRRTRRKWPLRHMQSNLCLAVLLLIVPTFVWAASSVFCLTPQAVLIRTAPRLFLQRHPWHEIVGVETSCTHGAGHAGSVGYVLHMKDGAAVDLMGGSKDFPQAYPKIVDALHGVSYVFDSAGAQGRCDYPHQDLLLQRP